MKRLHTQEKKNQKGSVTIEASLSLSIFVFFMISIICLINICRAQAKIGNALHLAALDISNMSYVYQLTGMYDMDVAISQSGKDAGAVLTDKAKSADAVLNNTENLLQLIQQGGILVENTEISQQGISESAEKLKEMWDKGTNELDSLKGNGQTLLNEMKGIADDPIGFAKLLVQFGIGKGAGAAKNVIAGLFAESLMKDNIEAGGVITDANSYLYSLGVEDGLDGMSFMASSIFGGDDFTDINLVAMYNVRLFPLLTDATIPFAQSASTRAWLSGDVITSVELPIEKKESVWGTGIDPRAEQLQQAIADEMAGKGSYVAARNNSGWYGYNPDTATLYSGRSVDVFSSSYRKADGTLNVNQTGILRQLEKKVKNVPQKLSLPEGGSYNLPQDQKVNMVYIVQVPENATDADVAAIQAALNKWKNENALPGNVQSLSFEIKKTGGNSPNGPE